MNSPSAKAPTKPIKLYRFSLSGHSHRVEMFLSLLAFGPAAARFNKLFKATFNTEEVTGRSIRLFEVMDNVLQKSPYLVGATPTLADVANYSYIAHAPEGGVSLAPYPHVRAWLASIEALPGFIPMVKSPATA